MIDTLLLLQIVLLFALSFIVQYAASKLRIPVIVGFLLTGIIAGPSVLNLLSAGEQHDLEFIGEIGVVMLLFTIGLEFSLAELSRMRQTALVGGSIQVFGTVLITALISWLTGLPFGQAVFFGFLLSLSSTAVVLKQLQDNNEFNAPHGRTSTAILIYQDIIVVPMMLVVPLLAGLSENIGQELGLMVLKAAAIIGATLFAANKLVPKLLYNVARLRNPELFLIAIFLICFAVAWLTNMLGLSLALGAFLAGLIISESEYSHQALSLVLPFKTVFTSFFFITIGALVNLDAVVQYPLVIIGGTLLVMFGKALIASIAALVLGYPLRTVLLVGLTLSQVGEFSFILSRVGEEYGLFEAAQYNIFLSISVFSLALTPFVMGLSGHLSEWLKNVGQFSLRGFKPQLSEKEAEDLQDHVLIVGFGVLGQNVARAMKAANIPYAAIEMNARTVRTQRVKGEPVYFGDAIHASLLEHLGIEKARLLVVAIPDVAAARAVVKQARTLSKSVFIIVRTRYMLEMRSLAALGADHVIADEFETSIEVFTYALSKYLVPKNQVDRLIAQVREENYGMVRPHYDRGISFNDLQATLGSNYLNTYMVEENENLANHSLAQLGFRQKYGITLLAVIRGQQIISNPSAAFVLQPGDKVVVFGRQEQVAAFASDNF